jgi:hypothetical protein
MMGGNSPGASGNYLFTKEIWQKTGGYPVFAKALDTWGFGFLQLAVGGKLVILPNSHYLHRYGHESYWVRETKNNLSMIALKIMEPFKNLFPNDEWSYMLNNDWFSNYGVRQIKTISNETGQTGILKKNKITCIKTLLKTNLKKVYYKLIDYINFCFIIGDYIKFKKKEKTSRGFKSSLLTIRPIIGENVPNTSYDRHYIYHPAWAARIIAQNKPKEHIDISSILSFSSVISAFIPVKFYDYRPVDLELSNFSSKAADLLKLPFPDNSVNSLSCMHTVEHVGLGRYGDPIDPDGDLKAMTELARVLAPNGDLLFVVPVGKPKIYYNAHRIYSYEQIISSFPSLKLHEFSLIPEKSGSIKTNATAEDVSKEKYACGCFWFKKYKK